jgi:hypothetical protein
MHSGASITQAIRTQSPPLSTPQPYLAYEIEAIAYETYLLW